MVDKGKGTNGTEATQGIEKAQELRVLRLTKALRVLRYLCKLKDDVKNQASFPYIKYSISGTAFVQRGSSRLMMMVMIMTTDVA